MDDPSALRSIAVSASPGSLREPERLLDALDAIVWEADPETFAFTWVSAGAERLLGHSRELWLEPGFWSAHVHPEERAATEATCRAALAAGEDHVVEYRMRAADGRWVWLRDHVRVAPQHVQPRTPSHGVMVDITREREASAALRAERDLNAAVLDGIDALVVLLDREGRILRTNRAAERIAGRTARTLVGRHFASRYAAPADRERIETLITRVVSRGAHAGCEVTLEPRSGGERVLAWSFTGQRDAQGEVANVLVTGADITERLVADRALRDLEHELRHAHRLDALGRLASGVAHDFHNVLTAIIGFADVLAADVADRPESRALAEEIHGAAEHGCALTRQLKTLAQKGAPEERPVDPRAELEQMRDLLARLIGEDVVLDLQIDSGDALLRCDPGPFTQIVLNLALNARDAMPRGGRLTIATEVEHLPVHEAQQRGLPEHCVRMTVRDTGVGMDEATRLRVFEPWFTTKGSAGTGIGLAVVHDAVRRAGGDIAIESAPGAGTRFLLWFPCVHAPAPPPAPAARSTVEPGARGRVLVVEDEASVRRLMHETLRRQGLEVIDAADGREALARAAAFTGTFDLLVTDVVMPGMSGREVAERLQRDGRVARVLFVSGYPDDAMHRHGVLPASESFLAKPFTPGVFARRVRELLGAVPTT